MPKLIDIAIFTSGKTAASDSKNAIRQYARKLESGYPELSFLNKLKTEVIIGSESNLGKQSFTKDGNGIFAPWRNELNRQPRTDIFELQPINTVRNKDAEYIREVNAIEKEEKLTEWLEGVDARMKKLGFKP